MIASATGAPLPDGIFNLLLIYMEVDSCPELAEHLQALAAIPGAGQLLLDLTLPSFKAAAVAHVVPAAR